MGASVWNAQEEGLMTTRDMTATQPRRGLRWLWILLGALALGTVLFIGTVFSFVRGLSDPGPPVAGVTEVAVRDNAFAPGAIEVPAGTTVTWAWQGNNQHNVVGDDFESPVQADGEFAHTFAEPGSYDYECTLHFGMNGEVVVTEA
jgi:plastocyanin